MTTLPKLGLAASFTADPIGQALGRDGFACVLADFNQVHTSLLDPDAAFEGPVDVIVVLWRLEDVFTRDLQGWTAGVDEAGVRLRDGALELVALVRSAAADSGANLIVGVPPHPVGFGIDLLDPGSSGPIELLLAQIRAALQALADEVPSVRLVDHAVLVSAYGYDNAHDERNQMLYRQPYRPKFVELVAREVGRTARSFTTPPPKAVVVDADNTLWGGVVGEVGPAGVRIGGTFPGAAFESFQTALRSLRAKGVLLALCSKNDQAAVDEVFHTRPEMVLQPDDFAASRVNWEPKSDNIASIAEQFNIGLDSIVFVDDSSFELAEVSAKLPAVRCLQVPEELEELPDLLSNTGWFRSIRISQEDRDRTQMIQVEAERSAAASTVSHDDFLQSLGLVVELSFDDQAAVERAAQLTNKTNQFNLTTIRRTPSEIAQIVGSDTSTLITAVVADRFGSYGLVALAVADQSDDTLVIDSLLMSCRVLKRGVESAVLAAIADLAKKKGISRLEGRYVPTAKNGQVADLYRDHGFIETADGVYVLDDLDSLASPQHITVQLV